MEYGAERTTSRAFREHFDGMAARFPQYRKRYAYYWSSIVNFLNYYIHEESSVLEVGCGTGETLSRLKGRKRTGIDISPEMIRVGKERHPGLDLRVMEAERPDLGETYDVIVLPHVMGYFHNVQEVMEALRTVCHGRTKILISYYNFIWEPVLYLADMLGLRRRTPRQNWLSEQDIKNILALAGYEPYRSTRGMLLPVNIPVLSWILNRYLAALPVFRMFCLNKYICARPVPEAEGDWAAKYSVSVVIPARNEEGNITRAVERLPAMGRATEVIFVEGHSTDGTWQKIEEVQAAWAGKIDIKAVRQDGKGKGDAVRKGYSLAAGDVLMILDADLTVPPEELPRFYKAIATGRGEFINGSRLVYPMEKQAMRLLNLIGNKFFSMMFSWILSAPVKDTLCGTKVMFRDDYNRLIRNRSYFGDFDPFGDFDLLFGAHKLNLKIIDLPVRYRERTYGETNISRFRHGLLLLRMVAYAAGKIRFRVI